MSTDRELLEMAAKAVGLVGYRYCDFWRGMAKWNDSDGGWFEIDTVWNPRRDAGAAMKLAIYLNMTLAVGVARSDAGEFCEFEMAKVDPVAATCLAIVCAAAAIGRAMP